MWGCVKPRRMEERMEGRQVSTEEPRLPVEQRAAWGGLATRPSLVPAACEGPCRNPQGSHKPRS